jgi:hypothetical protein
MFSTSAGVNVHSTTLLPACYQHCATESGSWSSITTQGYTLHSALGSFFEGTPAAAVVDSCVGFNCNPTCPAS